MYTITNNRLCTNALYIDDQILADLLTHEVRSDESKGRADEKPEYSGSESDEEMEDVESSDEEEEQFIVKVKNTLLKLVRIILCCSGFSLIQSLLEQCALAR